MTARPLIDSLRLTAFGLANADVPGPALINNYRASLVVSLSSGPEQPVAGLSREAFQVTVLDGPGLGGRAPGGLAVLAAVEAEPGTYVLALGRSGRGEWLRGTYALAVTVRYHEGGGADRQARTTVRLDV